MLIETTITKTETVQVELKVPAYYKHNFLDKWAAICEDEQLVLVGTGHITSWKPSEGKYYKEQLGQLQSSEFGQIEEKEFFQAYVAACESFDKSLNVTSL